METRPLSREDLHSMWVINEQGLPGTGQVSQEALAELLDLAVLSLGAYQQGSVGWIRHLSAPWNTLREPQLCMVQHQT